MSFRPLAGMNCNVVDVLESRDGWSFPSPRGDELQQDGYTIWVEPIEFPSPRGDELQPRDYDPDDEADEFPSPRGDELQHLLCGQGRGRHGVSVPSRG